MPTAKNTLAHAQCTLCSARVWKSAIVARPLGLSSALAILPIAWSCSLCRWVTVAGMSSRRSKSLIPATRFLAPDIPCLRSASYPNRLSIALASGMSVAHPRMAPRTSCMYVLHELASTPLVAMPVPTVPHSSVLACMTLSCASHAIPTVVTPGGVALEAPWSPCHCWWSAFMAFV